MSTKPVFISYSRKDTEFVNRFIERLRSAGVNLWIDKNIKLGGRWDNSIETALESCDDVLIIASNNAMESNNVMDEVAYALEENKRVIPVRIEDCEMNFRLRRIQHLDYFENEEKSFERLLAALNIGKTPSKQTQKDEIKPPAQEERELHKTDESKASKKRPRSFVYASVVLIIAAIIYLGGSVFSEGEADTNNDEFSNNEIIDSSDNSNDNIEFEEPVVLTDQEDWDSIPQDAQKLAYETHLANYQECIHKTMAEEIIKGLNELEYEIATWKRAEEANEIDLFLNYIEDFGKNSVYYENAIEKLKILFNRQGYVQYSESSGLAYFEIFEESPTTIPKENDLIYALKQRNVRGGKMGTPQYNNVLFTTGVDEAFIVLEVELRGAAYWVKIAY